MSFLLSLDGELSKQSSHNKLPWLDVSLNVDRGGEPDSLLRSSPGQHLAIASWSV